MNNLIEITSLDQPGADVFSTLTEAQLRNRLEPEKGVFIAESPKVIRVALDAGYEPTALLCERKHLTGDASDILADGIRPDTRRTLRHAPPTDEKRGRNMRGRAAYRYY